jgi:hypothetical protein
MSTLISALPLSAVPEETDDSRENEAIPLDIGSHRHYC